MRIKYLGQTKGRQQADRCAEFSWKDSEERFALDVLEVLEKWGYKIDWVGVGDDDWNAKYCPIWDREEYEQLKFDYKCAQGVVKKGVRK